MIRDDDLLLQKVTIPESDDDLESIQGLSPRSPDFLGYKPTFLSKVFELWKKYYFLILLFIASVVLLFVFLIIFKNKRSNLQPTLILISLDGFRNDYLYRNFTPTIFNLANNGIKAEFLQPVFPSVTFANHYSIATGLYPENHGIVANQFYDPSDMSTFNYHSNISNTESKWWGGEPIWITAERHKLKTATCMFPGSEALIHEKHPTYYRKFDKSVTPTMKNKQILEWLDLNENEKPHLIVVYHPEIDSAGHLGGPDSKLVDSALELIDHSIKQLVDSIEEKNHNVNFIIVSDHGMTSSGGGKVVFWDDFIDKQVLDYKDNGPFVLIYPKNESDTDNLYNKLLAGSKKNPHFQVYKRQDIPLEYQYSKNEKIGSILLIADQHYLFSIREGFNKDRVPVGAHGYNNSLADMHGLFIASGPTFMKGKTISGFKNLNIYNLASKVLGMRNIPANNGTQDILDEFSLLMNNS